MVSLKRKIKWKSAIYGSPAALEPPFFRGGSEDYRQAFHSSNYTSPLGIRRKNSGVRVQQDSHLNKKVK
jgi:hypothetical protein